MTPKKAIQEGADYLVMGRAILGEKDPVKTLELITKEIDAV
jgi:orotidine-5'-phosphate decarboxylase